MYPDLQILLEHAIKTHIPSFFSYFKTFGIFAALAFLAAAYVLKRELLRKEMNGLFQPELLPIDKAKKFLSKEEFARGEDPFEPIYPHQRFGELILLAAIGGFAGAKIFNAFETWNDFVKDPVGSLLSGSGLTFYGGLIVAALLIFYYCKRHKINFAHFCDAIAPALMLAYSIGRLGCHFSGDGDWGIFNSAYISMADATIKPASLNDYNGVVMQSADYFTTNFGSITNIPFTHIKAPSIAPDWLVAMNFHQNVINEGIPFSNCTGNYCHMLPVPVLPTSLYESIICLFLFVLLLSFKNKMKYGFHLFGLYLILNGLERFFIEKIKVNYRYDWGFLHPAQSEIISVTLMLIGIILLFYKNKKNLII